MSALNVRREDGQGARVVFDPIYLTSDAPQPRANAFTFEVRKKDSPYRDDLIGRPLYYYVGPETVFLGVLNMQLGSASSPMLIKLGDGEVWCCTVQVIEYGEDL